jgi:hypothetical protein
VKADGLYRTKSKPFKMGGKCVDISFKTKFLRYTIAPNGKNLEFTDTATGRNYIVDGYCGKLVDKEGNVHYPVSVVYDKPNLKITYKNGILVVIEVTEHREYLTFTLASISNEDIYSVSIADIEVKIDYDNDSSFIASCIGMTLGTRMEEYPGQNTKLYAEAFKHIGLLKTMRSNNPPKVAIIGTPEVELRRIMKDVIDEIPDGELPKSKTGGPYACEIEMAKCTYTNLGSPVTKENIEEIIAAMKKYGITQASLHQGAMYRQGDFHVNGEYYPGGIDDFKAIINRFHEENMLVGLHPYTFFLSKPESLSKYTTPVPHKDIDTLNEFTLGEDVDEHATEIIVNEPIDHMSATIGYSLQNTLILWIDDELICFSGLSKTYPYTFTGCTRGAYGTKVSSHKKGARVGHLKSYFGGYLAPKKNSELFYEIARNTAEFYNECGFDAMYLDAIDGVFILDGNEFAWYHAMAFINEMFKYLKRPVIFDCCYGPQYPGTWFVRTRFGALDSPLRAYNDFNDVHVEYDEKTAVRMYLTPELGWWNLYPEGYDDKIGWQAKVMTIEELEYLCVKHLALDACQCYRRSMLKFKEYPILNRFADMITQYNEVREKKYFNFDEKTRKKLREPKAEFTLVKENGKYALYEMKTTRYRADSFEEGRNIFNSVNPYDRQKPFIRIEPLYTADNYDSPHAQVLLDLDETKTLELNRVYTFDKPLDTGGKRGIGVWIYGDGRGETINIRLRSSGNFAGIGDHFIIVDFVGWRCFVFYESQNGEMDRSEWPRAELVYRVFEDVGEFYAFYRNPVDYSKISKIEILTIAEGKYDLKMKPIVSLPHHEQTFVNPTVSINGKSVTFKTALKSGTYLECSADGECKVYDMKGNILDTPEVVGDIPYLNSGNNELMITSNESSKYLKRAAVTSRVVGSRIS